MLLSVFRALSDDEVSFCKDLTRSFVMFKAMYLFTALYSAQYTDLTVWFIVFTIFGAVRSSCVPVGKGSADQLARAVRFGFSSTFQIIGWLVSSLTTNSDGESLR